MGKHQGHVPVDTSSETRLLESEQVTRIIRRLAYEILERNRGASNLVVLGILESGALLGRAICEVLEHVEGGPVPFYPLDVTGYRDDLAQGPERTMSAADESTPRLEDRDVILVDDVLFTGRTARAALDAVVRFGRPRSIQLTVLIDRGHREYPIQPDFVGRRVPTKHREDVRVRLGDVPVVDVVE